jgi:hypothetical protein
MVVLLSEQTQFLFFVGFEPCMDVVALFIKRSESLSVVVGEPLDQESTLLCLPLEIPDSS